MIYPENLESKIGFDEVKSKLIDFTISNMGAEYVSKICFLNEFMKINQLLKQTNEFKEVLQFESGFPTKNYFDLRIALKRLKTDGTFILLEDLHDLNLSLLSSQEILFFFNEERQKKYPELFKLTSLVNFERSLLNEIHSVIDEKARIRDSASESLRIIRRQLVSLNSGIRSKAQQFIKKANSEGWVREGAELSIRNNRMVIPMLVAHKRKIRGFIHDESSSGQTVYIEPDELFETNNQIRELEIEQDKEVKKILLQISQKIRPHIDDLLNVYIFIGLMDFISAKAKFAIELNAHLPNLSNNCVVNWKNALHPLLFLNYKKRNKKVVSQDIYMSENQRIILISGPNAGGKSVALKTLALNQYMLQSGLLIAAKPTSEAGVFKDIFIDIGDEQSLEDDLSTYSSHLQNMKFIANNLSNKSLILIDEFGSGTEPDLGGSIAEASLNYFYKKGAFALITTHYSNLKEFANKNKNIINAAMSFDSDKLIPSFKLKIGKPGSSFAYEIAQKIGLKKEILDYAYSLAGADRINFDRRLQELEQEKEKIKEQKKRIESADNFLNETIIKYENLSKMLQIEKNDILKSAKNEAKSILSNSNKLIENTIKSITEAKADKNKTKHIRKKFEEDKEKLLNPKTQKIPPHTNKSKMAKPVKESIEKGGFKEGDFVKIKNQSGVGIIEKIKLNSAKVSFDNMRFEISLDKIELTTKKHEKITKNLVYSSLFQDKSTGFSAVLDIRGKRADEAVNIVLDWFDDAVLLGEYDLQILHGKGNGTLRQIVRQALKKNPEVISLKDAPIELGGAGLTIVVRKK